MLDLLHNNMHYLANSVIFRCQIAKYGTDFLLFPQKNPRCFLSTERPDPRLKPILLSSEHWINNWFDAGVDKPRESCRECRAEISIDNSMGSQQASSVLGSRLQVLFSRYWKL